jgi:hypothetical protein
VDCSVGRRLELLIRGGSFLYKENGEGKERGAYHESAIFPLSVRPRCSHCLNKSCDRFLHTKRTAREKRGEPNMSRLYFPSLSVLAALIVEIKAVADFDIQRERRGKRAGNLI